ncbi:NADH:flavin oxidoreductase/NADH oxidase family protein [Amycolatopsis sp. YIM 10]|uniref:NADH:flavin oxidoreductase/NADH oxidase family protein n=1 Tax=Amycolatopsis sp. YIM 10 TaxID=2653857 RepID=UPI00128FFC70|nr:NADH:flavin oxidoreductase/NADH oxidase family protein [Amycolatopsis sp. YIM 10]QFU87084.1 NADH oxidase [Amycolatopsis sp. YIM 10]
MTTNLSDQLTLPCGAVLGNRIAKAGMSEQLAARDGAPTAELCRLYATWARSGAGLLITGNVMINRDGLVEPRNIILDDDRHLGEFKTWADTVHAGGAAVWMQINHPGRVATVPFTRRPVAPSAGREPVPGYNLRKARELTATRIQELIRSYAHTAELAVAAGFDGVQIHAAHGYLLSQFLSPLANTRGDHYGRDAAGRRRALLETVAAVREAVGPHVPVSVKLNSKDFQHGGFTEAESLDVAAALGDSGVDLLEITGGNYAEPAMEGVHHTGRAATGEAYFADYATKVRERVGVPLMLTGGLRTRETMQRLLGDGTTDVIGIARPMAFVPDYPARLLAGEPEPLLPTGLRPTGYRPLDGYLQLATHNAQFHRIAAGRTPQTQAGIGTVLRALATMAGAMTSQVVLPR